MNFNEDANYQIISKTLEGLEPILAQELEEIGAENIQVLNRAVSYTGNIEMVYRANLHLRTALNVMVVFHEFKAKTYDEIYKKAMEYNWSALMTNKQTFMIRHTVLSTLFSHTQHCALKLKDAVVDRMRNETGARPHVDKDAPDLVIQLHIANDRCTLLLDSSGDPLYMRGYRKVSGPAPVNEVLAAGLIRLSGWKMDCDLIDPMCGSGTIPLEAGLIALNIAPGSYRKYFGFMQWKNFDDHLWENTKMLAQRKVLNDFPHKIIGSEIDRRTLNGFETNLRHIRSGNVIKATQTDFFEFKPKTESGFLIFNPPYGERIGTGSEEDMNLFYKRIGDKLKNDFQGFTACILSGNPEAIKHVGLKPARRFTVFNGPIECKFFKYELYQGSKKAKNNPPL